MEEKISIIIPFFNAEAYLENCLESVKKQTYKQFECLLIDDGSNDGSLAIAKRYSDIDNRFKVIVQKNSGVSEARNNGIVQSKGKYITFIDADDWIEPLYLEYLLYSLKENRAEMSISAVMFHKNGEKKIVGYTHEGVCDQESALISLFNDAEMRPVVWGKLFIRDIISKNHLFMNKEISYSEDILYVCKYLLRISKISMIAKPLYHYRLDNMSSAQNVGLNTKKYNMKWDSAWLAYIKMEQQLKMVFNDDNEVIKTFKYSKTEFARNMLYRQKKYNITTEITDEMQDFLNRNWKKYCLNIGNLRKSISMFLFVVLPRAYDEIYKRKNR